MQFPVLGHLPSLKPGETPPIMRHLLVDEQMSTRSSSTCVGRSSGKTCKGAPNIRTIYQGSEKDRTVTTESGRIKGIHDVGGHVSSYKPLLNHRTMMTLSLPFQSIFNTSFNHHHPYSSLSNRLGQTIFINPYNHPGPLLRFLIPAITRSTSPINTFTPIIHHQCVSSTRLTTHITLSSLSSSYDRFMCYLYNVLFGYS